MRGLSCAEGLRYSMDQDNFDYVEKRKSILTQLDLERISQMIYSPLEKELHMEHHEWIKGKREKEGRCKNIRDKVAVQAIGWGVVTAIGAFGYLIALGIAKYIKQILQ